MEWKQLITLRKAKKLSQSDLGKVFHVTQATISTWENGTRKPTIGDLARLADFFNVTIDYLVGRTPKEVYLITKEEYDSLMKAKKALENISAREERTSRVNINNNDHATLNYYEASTEREKK